MIDENDIKSLNRVSLVSRPAIEVKGKCFSEEKEYRIFSDEEKQLVVGPAMIPGLKMKRKDPNGNLYMGYFTKETIAKMVEIFNRNIKDKATGVINDDHTDRMVDGFIVGSWIIEDSYYDKSKYYGYDLPVGTWFMEVKVDDKEYWENEIKGEGKYSFSIEGLIGTEFRQGPNRFSEENEWMEVLNEIGWLRMDDEFRNFLKKL